MVGRPAQCWAALGAQIDVRVLLKKASFASHSAAESPATNWTFDGRQGQVDLLFSWRVAQGPRDGRALVRRGGPPGAGARLEGRARSSTVSYRARQMSTCAKR